MGQKLIIVLCAVFSADLVIGANNVVLKCPCQLKSSCFKPLDLSKVNETSCADENFVRCCSESESIVTQIVVISSTTSTESKHANNISVVMPSEMSGIPQTTPSNMPDDYMIQMVDRQSGDQMLLVFPKHEQSSSEAPIMTTTLTTPSSTTTTLKAVPETRNTTSKPKPKRIPVKRGKINSNKQFSKAENTYVAPKPNTKIYDVSRRTNFLRRHPDTPQEIFEPIRRAPTRIPAIKQQPNDELRYKIDLEHKTMIEHLKNLLTAHDNSPSRRPLEIGKNQRFKTIEDTINIEMEKVIDNMKLKKKPYRGKIKYQDYKWAAIPDGHQEQRSTPKTTTTKRPITTPNPKSNFQLHSNKEFDNGPTLLANFKPSPLWSLQVDNIDIVEFNTRNPRHYTTFEHVGNENGFVPVVYNGESLQIVGPVPQGFKNRIDDSRLIYELPARASSNF